MDPEENFPQKNFAMRMQAPPMLLKSFFLLTVFLSNTQPLEAGGTFKLLISSPTLGHELVPKTSDK